MTHPTFWLVLLGLFCAAFSSYELFSLSGGEFTLPVIVSFVAVAIFIYVFTSSRGGNEGFRDCQVFLRRSTVDGWNEKTNGSIYGPSRTLEGEILPEGEEYGPEGDTSWSTSGFPWYSSAY